MSNQNNKKNNTNNKNNDIKSNKKWEYKAE